MTSPKKTRHITQKTDSHIAVSPKKRHEIVDALRGIAVTLMFFYHFCFDLDYFHWVSIDFYQQPFWLNFRAFIVTLFLTLVGVSLVLANPSAANWRAALPRLLRLLGCASLVSVGSYAVFPGSMIFFGVLHFILIASVLGLWLLRFRVVHLPLGVLLIVLGAMVQHPFFDQAAFQWLGLMTHKPITEDYVPMLPWFGVVLVGMFLAKAGEKYLKTPWQARGVLRWFTFAGKHSLLLYMIHQPILMGLLWVVLR